MNDQSKTKHVLIQEPVSLRQGINELKQLESEWKKEKACQIIKSALLLDFMREFNGLISIPDVSIKNTNR